MTGYVRQSAADIIIDAEITAAPLNNEFNALESAFSGSSGHNHSGGTGNGPKINLTSSVTGTLPLANGGTGGTDAPTARTSLGLGTMSTQNKEAVDITGGTVVGITDLAIADGGTGASDAPTAFGNLKQEATTAATGVVSIATPAEFISDTAGAKALVPEKVWDSAEEVTLTDAATVDIDLNTFINAKLTLGGNRTLGTPTNAKKGQSGCIRILTNGTNRTLAYSSGWVFPNAIKPNISTTNSEDLLFYYVIDTNKIFGNLIKAIG